MNHQFGLNILLVRDQIATVGRDEVLGIVVRGVAFSRDDLTSIRPKPSAIPIPAVTSAVIGCATTVRVIVIIGIIGSTSVTAVSGRSPSQS